MPASEYFAILVIGYCILERVGSTEEHLNIRQLGLGSNPEAFHNKNIQQIIRGAGPSDVGWPQPAKVNMEKVQSELSKLNSTYVSQNDWPQKDVELGAVTAVSLNKDGDVVVFHRVDRVWDQNTFNIHNVYTQRKLGAIRKNTILTFERESGRLRHEWGKNLFYMPHGLTVDHEDNIWVTDVALHQVFKFPPKGGADQKTPLLTLGTAFTPGNSETKFCKPTSVAVLENGDFFVADGYCNARILKYTKDGEKILSWGQNSFSGVSYDVAPKNYLAVPHALTLVPEQELICTADRENGRVQCFFWTNGTFHSQYHSTLIGDRLFSVAYTPADGGQFVVVNGPVAEMGRVPERYNEVQGFIMNMTTKKVLSKFGPNGLQFSNPHDVAVTADGREVYVADLNPTRVYKFVHKNGPSSSSLVVNSINTSKQRYSKPQTTSEDVVDGGQGQQQQQPPVSHMPGGTAILVASLMLLFALTTFGLALLVARRRKRGCLPFGTKRRHAWDFPVKGDGFNLGSLLMDRRSNRRNGFEKLDQNASDEEQETTSMHLSTATATSSDSNALASAQFA